MEVELSLLHGSLWVVDRSGERMNEGAEPLESNERTVNRTRFEARGRIQCVDSNGKRHLVNKFAHVLIEGDFQSEGETVYRLDDGSTAVFVSDGVYRIAESGIELRCVKESP
jgi:hypothetical protein